MSNVLIVYASKNGQTLKICQKLRSVIERHDHHVTLVPIEAADNVDLNRFDKIIIGASIHYGHHDPAIQAFIEHNQPVLDSKDNAFFSVNVVARKAEKRQPDTNPYLKKFLKRMSWTPKQLTVFAGKIDYPSYSLFDRTVIRFIMWMTKGPTDPTAIIEFTDWEQVTAFGELVSQID
ncbi:MAG: menaquinone-dependent protoporphyrinogen IX dehydrogenase [Methylobacter sp.]|nr:menaquinone-dependent protoporphyrinogen IX dehydrogenase [Methylobacter sp.]